MSKASQKLMDLSVNIGNWRFHKGVKGTWSKFSAKNPALIFEEARDFSPSHTPDSRIVLLEDRVETRIGKSFLYIRLLTPEIPTDDPIALDEEAQICAGGWRVS